MLIPRRAFMAGSGLGAASMALDSLLAKESGTPQTADTHVHARNGRTTQTGHHRATARSVIFLFMAGAPSQVDLLDPKAELAKLAGKDVPDSIARLVPKIKRAGLQNLMASPWEFHQHGESGLPISTLLPETARHADELCVIRSMTHRNPVHGPGECVALTGSASGDRPSLGAWSLYGLGSESDRLPEFVAMNLHSNGMQYPQAAGWGTGFLPAGLQGTVVDPIRGIKYVAMPKGTDNKRRRRQLEVLQTLNKQFLENVRDHSELEARIRGFETAFKMQTAAPELFDLKTESAHTHAMYGMESDKTKTLGRSCLLARRMVERGVRFIQVRVGGWDAHGNIKGNHTNMAAITDKPIAALLTDLKQRGLLDETLVVWGGEFGRTPTMEGRGKGRDHSPAAYSVWLAGGGIRGGSIIGQTDPIGYTVTERPVGPLDLHATILHSLGIQSDRLVYDHHGLKETPLGVTGGAPVLEAFH